MTLPFQKSKFQLFESFQPGKAYEGQMKALPKASKAQRCLRQDVCYECHECAAAPTPTHRTSAIACMELLVICLLTVASLVLKLSSSLRRALMFCPMLACHCLAICRVDFAGAAEEVPFCQGCRCCTPLLLGLQIVVELPVVVGVHAAAAEGVKDGFPEDVKPGRTRLPTSNDLLALRSVSADNARVALRGCTTNAFELWVRLPEAGNAADSPDFRPSRFRCDSGV